MLTFCDWFHGRFWLEWVVLENSPGEQANKASIYRHHLGPVFGNVPLDKITAARISTFRAEIAGTKTTATRNSILACLSKALTFAVEVGLLTSAPKIRRFRHEAPEVTWLDVEQYAKILRAALEEGPTWYVAVCLAGEAGLRVGEVKGLRWREDVDLLAGTLTVNQQIRHGHAGPPKGRRRRTVPLTTTLQAALRGLEVVRTGFVTRDDDGQPQDDRTAYTTLLRIYRRAGIPCASRPWHQLRHTFGTHAAAFGANPWRLQAWLGHASIMTTHKYVHTSEAHRRTVPEAVLRAGQAEMDPDRRVLAMLGARLLAHGNVVAANGAG